jgi:hypothetical protein
MPAKKHHYVPVFYQKGFACSDHLLWVYDRKLHTYKRLRPKSICWSENLYTVQNTDMSGDTRIETDILGPIENAAATAIRSLRVDTKPDPQVFGDLIRFISFQYTRLPSFGRAVSKIIEVTLDQMMQMQFATPERAALALSKIGETGTDPQSMVEAVTNRHIRVTANERGFLRHMFDVATTLGNWLQNADWTFLVAPPTIGFVVCDHPFVTVPPQGSVLEGVSFGIPGSTSYFPINRHMCLKFREGDYGLQFAKADSQTVRTVNQNIAANSDRFIMGRSRSQLESIVKKSASTDFEPGERFSVEERTSPDESFMKFKIHPRRYFY